MKPTEPNTHAEPLSYAPRPPRRHRNLLITGGVLTGILLMLVFRFAFQETKTPPPSPAPPTAGAPTPDELRELQLKVERQQRWQTKVDPRIKLANEACDKAIEKAIRVLTAFVEERKTGVRPLAEAMVTYRSKWNLVVSQLPWWLGGDPNAHRAFLEEKFNEHVFTSEQMKHAVEAAVKTYFNHVQAIENQLLVDVRTDLEDLPQGVIPESETTSAFSKRFEQLIRDVTPEVQKSLGLDVTRELAAWVGGELAAGIAVRVLTAVATRLGVSAGILTAGASASWATFGLSVLAAIVIDQTVGWIINRVTDPVGQLETRIKEMLDETANLIIDGEGETHGLREELGKVNSLRERLRAEALSRIVLGD